FHSFNPWKIKKAGGPRGYPACLLLLDGWLKVLLFPVLLVVQFAQALAVGTKGLVQGALVAPEQAVDAFDLVIVNGFAIRTPFFIDGVVFRLDLFVELVELVAGSIQDGVKGGDLLAVEFDRAGKIGHVPLAKLLWTQLLGRAGILTGLYRTDGIEPVG